jgi:Family of unknown function (DUF5522)
MARPPLVQGVDYYLENGKFVFTAEYHLKRGHCCNSRCRHCPYGLAPDPTTVGRMTVPALPALPLLPGMPKIKGMP